MQILHRYMDVTYLGNAYVHGWTVVGQRICTGRTVLGQRICTGRTVLGQCRSYCRGAIAEEQISAIHGGSISAFMWVMIVDRCPQFMPLTVNGAAVYLIVIILAVGKCLLTAQ